MADRNFNEFPFGTLEKGKPLAKLFLNVAIGATGAPTLNKNKSKGIASIARNSAGNYTITLQDRYIGGLLSAIETLVLAAGAPASASNVNMLIRADNSSAAAKTIQIEFVSSAGAAIELTNGLTLLLEITLKSSSLA